MVESVQHGVAAVKPLSHAEAMGLAEQEYRRFADVLDQLDDGEWGRPTSCPGWTVREIAGHVLGSMRSAASQREQRSQLKAARQRGGSVADGLTAVQVARTAPLTPHNLRQEVRAMIQSAVRGRRRTPAPLRRWLRIPTQLPVSAETETWRLGYLVDQVLTRDTWMHRSDITLATGRQNPLSGVHDGRLVALVVADWSRRHGRDYRLTLTGPAGGIYTAGNPTAELTADAESFCRALTGRGTELPFNTEVPF